MRAAVYVRTSAATPPTPEPERELERLADVASVRGWDVVATWYDHTPRPDAQRRNVEAIVAQVKAGAVDVVIVPTLACFFRDAPHLGILAGKLLELGVGLVAVDDHVDTTTPAGLATWRTTVETLHRFEARRHREAIMAGQALARAAGKVWHHQTDAPAIPLIEVRALWEGGASERQIHRRLRATGSRIGVGTLRRWLARMLEAGELDRSRREAAIAAAGGLPRGGRPRRPPRDGFRSKIGRSPALAQRAQRADSPPTPLQDSSTSRDGSAVGTIVAAGPGTPLAAGPRGGRLSRVE